MNADSCAERCINDEMESCFGFRVLTSGSDTNGWCQYLRKNMVDCEYTDDSSSKWDFYTIDRDLYKVDGGLDWGDKYEGTTCKVGQN